MFIINTYVSRSEIDGVGVFTAEDIEKGQPISKFDPDFDRLVPMETYANAPSYLKSFLDRYSFPHPDKPECLVFEVDNSRFMNHSLTPNTDYSDFSSGIAIRDIKAGEELTCDYKNFFAGYELLPPESER
ncbi:MAG: SET domain-containing protein [Parvularculaceae bacterium]|nr:SET domain-containing protein-lysine N-methyltransferase [Parvularculaceae bacterium]